MPLLDKWKNVSPSLHLYSYCACSKASALVNLAFRQCFHVLVHTIDYVMHINTDWQFVLYKLDTGELRVNFKIVF